MGETGKPTQIYLMHIPKISTDFINSFVHDCRLPSQSRFACKNIGQELFLIIRSECGAMHNNMKVCIDRDIWIAMVTRMLRHLVLHRYVKLTSSTMMLS